MIKAVLFDFDLTLIDSLRAYKAVMQDLESKHRILGPMMPLKEIFGLHAENFCDAVLKANKGRISLDEFVRLDKELMLLHYPGSRLRSVDFLKELNGKGIMLGIITGNVTEVVKKTLENEHNNGCRFDMVLTSEHFIDGKYKKEKILDVMNEWRLSNDEIAYVGDHPNDIIAAKGAGVIAIGITTGFYNSEELLAFKPDMVIDSLEELKLLF